MESADEGNRWDWVSRKDDPAIEDAPGFETKADVGADGVYDVTVQVTDGDLTDTQQIAVTVTDVMGETLNGAGGGDKLVGGIGGDSLSGAAGDDTLIGGADSDTLDGGAGADTLIGGAGADSLIGGSESDLFDYNLTTEGGDTIAGFQVGVGGDVLDIADILIGFAGDPMDLDTLGFVQLSDNGGATVVEVDADGTTSGANFVALATLSGVASGSVTVDDLVSNGNLDAIV